MLEDTQMEGEGMNKPGPSGRDTTGRMDSSTWLDTHTTLWHEREEGISRIDHMDDLTKKKHCLERASVGYGVLHSLRDYWVACRISALEFIYLRA